MENKTKGAGDDYPVIPLAQKTFRVRITKASSPQSWYKDKIGQEFDVYVNPDGDKTAFILERDRLASITQRFISSFDCEPVEQINKYVEMEKELASLKEENAKLKFRADLMAIYKQEKEDRDKILHQIKCTLYDRLTETEKLNDILKFFPTALKTFSDNK